MGCGVDLKSTTASGEAPSVASTSAGGSTASGDPSSSRSSSAGEHSCFRIGCGKPTWNGQQNEYCSDACKTPVCLRTGCGRPTKSGRPFDYCGAGCRPRGFISLTPVGSAQMCMNAACGKPTWHKNKLCEACCTNGAPSVLAPVPRAHEPYSI